MVSSCSIKDFSSFSRSFRKGLTGFILAMMFPVPLLAQTPQDEPFFLNLSAGTSAPCPSPDQYSRERPDPPGVVTRVGIGVAISDILEIIDNDQTFVADVWIALRWKDRRLADPARGEAYADCILPADNAWIPKLQLVNLRGMESNYEDITLIDAEGYVNHFSRKFITIYSPLDLREFPFDRQTLTLSIASILTVSEIKLEVIEQFTSLESQSVTNWTIAKPVAFVTERFAPIRGEDFSLYTTQLDATRDRHMYRRKLLVPVSLIVFMAWAIFWIKPSMTAPQMGAGTTAMLTLIAYQFALSGSLPRIPYLTRADTFLLMSLILVFVALMEAVATAALVNFDREAQAAKMDRVFRVAYPLAFILIIAFAVR